MVNLLYLGRIQFLIVNEGGKWSFEIETGDIEHKNIAGFLLGEGQTETISPFKLLTITGGTQGKIKAVIDHKGEWSIKGKWDTTIPSLKMPEINLYLSDLAIHLPFHLSSEEFSLSHYSSSEDPSQHHTVEKERGTIHLGDLSWNRQALGGIDLSLSFSENSFNIDTPIMINLWGGKVTTSNLRAESLTSPNRVFYGSIGIERLSLTDLFKDTNMPISGELGAEVSSLYYKGGRLVSDGTVKVKTMGGVIIAKGLSIEKPFDPWRKIKGSLFWQDIHLDRLTEKLPVGKMTGVIKGRLEGLEIEYGQPARFIMEVESVKHRGVSQTISVEAIHNLSLIGTGSSAISQALNSGINRFFSYYPYSKIGFQCILKHDIFSLKGLIQKGGKEYLITRGLFRGVDVINQNPENQISFKDMQERIKRIFEEKGSPVVK